MMSLAPPQVCARPAASPSPVSGGEWLASATRYLSRVPKVELHGHLSGCLRIETICELAKDADISLPEEELSAAVVLTEPAGTYGESFLPWKRVIDKVTARPENHFRLVREVAADLASDGVIYAELRTSVRLPFDATALRTMLDGIDAAARAAMADEHVDVRFILGFNRQQFWHVGPDEQVSIARRVVAAVEGHRERVVGFDLWGDETDRPPGAFADAYRLLRGAGFPLTIHAGEAGSVRYVREAMDILQCRRIGHGTAMVEDRELLDLARQKEIAVEICLSSNWLTRVIPSIAAHPLAELLASGLRTCLCADNTRVYDTSLSGEYAKALRAGLVTAEQLLDMAAGAATLTFLPADQQVELARKLLLTGSTRSDILRSLEALGSPR